MFKRILNWLTSVRRKSFTPAANDQELMKQVLRRLRTMPGGLSQPTGTEIRSIDGAIVRFTRLDDMTVAAVFTDGYRSVGAILPDGDIELVSPRR